MSSTTYLIYKAVKLLVYPLAWILILMVLAFLWSWGHRVRRGRVCLVLALLITYGLSIPVVSRQLAWSLEARYPAHTLKSGPGTERYTAVVVLAGGAEWTGGLVPEDRLKPSTIERVLYGRELMLHGLASTIVLSGGSAQVFAGSEHPAEALVMERFLRSLGNQDWTILTETHSRTTYENAVETTRLLGTSARIALVTSALHMPRAMAFFARQGMTAVAFPCEFTAGPAEPNGLDYIPRIIALQQSSSAIHEWVGLAVYKLAGKTS